MSTDTKGENALVRWLRQRLAADPKRVPIGIGDDMAAVRFDGRLVAVTTDMLLDGVHFETGRHSYAQIGHKAIACSLSDCAGMACSPRVATVSVALNEAMPLADVQQLYEGMVRIAEEFGCFIVGGDTTSWRHPLVIDVAMLAEPMASRGPLTRSGARAGDVIYVSGPLGGSLAGRHLSFRPRLELARALADREDVHALMDISDGLAMDLDRLCEASRCGARLDETLMADVISDAARKQSEVDGRSALTHALSDGEDFELLVVGERTLQEADLGLWATGWIVEVGGSQQAPLVMVDAKGTERPIAPHGYEHFQ